MRGKMGFTVVLLAIAAFVVSESQSFGGGHRRHGRSGGCHSACNTGCAAASCCDAAPAASAAASPSDAPAPGALAAPGAPDKGASASPPVETPQDAPSVTSRPSNDTNSYGRRTARRWSRRR